MGPFVPDLISDQMNLVVALILGVAFGVVLEQAGFSSSRRLAGVFYGYDFTVLRVFFTAAITAMSGVLLLAYAGLLDTDVIYVNPTWLLPAIVGGMIMGVGFILGGYCPGTSICAAAIGKVDAVLFIVGGLVGVFLFGELYPLYKSFYDSTALGPVKVFSELGIPEGLFAFLVIVAAVAAFAVTSMLERRVSSSAPSLTFPARWHRLAAAGILALGVALIFLPDRKTDLMNRVSDPEYRRSHQAKVMSSDEFAFRIVDRGPNFHIVDIRPSDHFAQFALPASDNIPVRDFFGKEWRQILSRSHVKKVVVAETPEEEQAACLLLELLGYENVYVLEGGLGSFRKTILDPVSFTSPGGRWDEDVMNFRRSAQAEIRTMIEEQKNKSLKIVVTERKIQGGC